MNGLRSAIGFLTILPLAPSSAPVSLASARGWFPLVGLLLGVAMLAFDLLATLLFGITAPRQPSGADTLPTTLSTSSTTSAFLWATMLVILMVALTRALHLDGFMDSCDALFGGFRRRRRLEIMRDPNVGAFAVVGVVCLLLIKVASLANLHAADSIRLAALLLFPCLSRWAMLLTMELYPYVRNNGLGTAFMERGRRRSRWQLALGFALTLLASFAFAGAAGIIMLVAASAVGWGIGAWARRLLGGVTGDIYGAVNEVAEATILLLAVALTSAFPLAINSPLLDMAWIIL